MKISYQWLSQFIDTGKTPDELSLILTNIGLEVESVDKVQAVAGGLEGLVIGYVKECGQHPNADRLKVTRVDVGGTEDLQIVCGANNVAAGQKVIVAPVGTTVHPVNGEPFKINKSKIRGEVSEGMICAEDEIGLGNDHDGIMVLPEEVKIGTLARDHFKLEDDYVFEIGLTPNRADAASHLGVARDLAAYLGTSITMPDLSSFKEGASADIDVIVEDTDACPRYSGLVITGLKVGESPDWLKNRLALIGVRAINNVVDVTNYILHGYGQPMHAFDLDAIAGNTVVVKKCAEGTKFVTLDGVERTLSAEDLMICDAQKPMCIGGVFGGAASGVKENTTAIFLESAWFNAVSVRKTSKRHGLKTDASFRFERGTDPNGTVEAMKRAALLLQEVAGGQVASAVIDIYPEPVKPFSIELPYANVDRLIGKKIDREQIKNILRGLQIVIKNETEDVLSLEVPPFKVDVTRDVDVIEEILRIYGYDNIEIPTQIRASLNYASKPDKETLQNQVSELLSANGFSEILNNSLSSPEKLDNADQAVQILNPLSNELSVMRQNLLYSGLEAIAYNVNRKSSNLRFYEFGKVYRLEEGKYIEDNKLAIFLSGNAVAEKWQQKDEEFSFYHIKALVDGIIERLGLQKAVLKESTHPNLDETMSYQWNNNTLAEFGMVSKKALKTADLSVPVYYAEFNWDRLLKAVRNNAITYKEVSKFPAVRRDLSLLLDKAVTFEKLKQVALGTERKLLKDVNVFDVYQGKNLPEGKKSYALSFTLQDEEKTLTDKQIDAIMQKLIYNLEKETGAEVRKA